MHSILCGKYRNPYATCSCEQLEAQERSYEVDRLRDRIVELEVALSEICQVDDADSWVDGHTGKMNEMARIAREALAPNDGTHAPRAAQ